MDISVLKLPFQEHNIDIQCLEKQLTFKISSLYIDEIKLRKVVLSTTNVSPARCRSLLLMFHQ
jgi:hypothetical protein